MTVPLHPIQLIIHVVPIHNHLTVRISTHLNSCIRMQALEVRDYLWVFLVREGLMLVSFEDEHSPIKLSVFEIFCEFELIWVYYIFCLKLPKAFIRSTWRLHKCDILRCPIEEFVVHQMRTCEHQIPGYNNPRTCGPMYSLIILHCALYHPNIFVVLFSKVLNNLSVVLVEQLARVR